MAALIITDLGGGDVVVEVVSDTTWRSIETAIRAVHQRDWRQGTALAIVETIVARDGSIERWHCQDGVMESVLDPRKHSIAHVLYLKP